MSEIIRLGKAKREKLRRTLRGSLASNKATRLRVLLAVDEGMGTTEAAAHVGCGTATVKRVKARYRKGGVEAVIEDGRKSGRPRKTTTLEEKELIALACTKPPGTSERWTVKLLAKHFDKDISSATVHRILARDGIKPWREKNVVHPDHQRRVSQTSA